VTLKELQDAFVESDFLMDLVSFSVISFGCILTLVAVGCFVAGFATSPWWFVVMPVGPLGVALAALGFRMRENL
jgi:hypothetical protein